MTSKTKAALERELKDTQNKLSQSLAETIRAEKSAEGLTVENNALRDRLMETTQLVERLHGYLDGMEDSKPPELQPAPRPSHRPRFGELVDTEALNHCFTNYGLREPVRQWWHR